MHRHVSAGPSFLSPVLAAVGMILGCSGQSPETRAGRPPVGAPSPPPATPLPAPGTSAQPPGPASSPPSPPAPAPASALPPRCEDRLVTPLRPDEQSPLGFAATEILSLAVGTHVLPLEWQESFRGAGELRIRIESPGNVRFIDQVPDRSCMDSLNVDVQIALSTADGGVDETFPATLRAYTSDIVAFDHYFDREAIARIWRAQGGSPQPGQLTVGSVFTSRGVMGILYASGAADPRGPVAVWPYTPECHTGVAITRPEVRPNLDDMLQRFRGAGRLRRVDGTDVQATFTPRPVERGSCYHANSMIEGDDGLEALVDLEIEPVAGNPLSIRLRITSDLDEGRLRTAGMVAAGPCGKNQYLSVPDFLARCGDWGVDLTGYHGAHFDLLDGGIGVHIIGETGTGCVRHPDALAPSGLLICDTFEYVDLGKAFLLLPERD